MAKICFRSAWLGRSTKNNSSKRPLRISSGGSTVTLLHVAATNTGAFRSCIQDKKRREQSRRHACIRRSRIRPASGKDFLQFVDPQHAGRETFGDSENFLDALLGLTNVFVVDCGRIELHQRQLPFARRWRARTCSCRIPARPE